MLKPVRLLAFTCLALVTFSLPASAQDGVDTTKLPRVEGARELYAHPASTSFATADAVPETADRVRDALLALGWKPYSNPFANYARTDRFRTMEFKKGRQSLNVSVSTAPAQRGETAVSYSALVHANDLPIPQDATDIGFAPDRPYLQLFNAGTVAQSLAFFRTELATMGWTEWLPTDPAKIVADAAGTRAITYFTRERNEPLALVLQRMSDGRTTVHLTSVPAQTLTAIEQNPPHRNAKASIGNGTAVVSAATAPHGWTDNLPASVIETAAPRKQARAPQTPRDVRDLPRPAGAWVKDEDARKNDPSSMRYAMPLSLADAKASLTRLLINDGWVAFVEPLAREDGRSLYFKQGEQRVSLHFHFDGENNSRSGVWITSTRNWNDIPTPPGSTDVVFDDRRPLLDAIAPGTVEGALEFFRTELTARGWSEWSPADNARYPNARLETTIDGGLRAYFTHEARDRQAPIQVSLGRRADGRVDIEVKVPPFARPQQLKAEWTGGLPRPELIKSGSGRDGSTVKELTAVIPAELDVVLAFYRRELATRNWKEDTGAVVQGDVTTLGFSSPNDGTLVLKLSHRYDLTVAELTQQLTPAIIAARAKAKREAEEKAARDFEARMQASVPASQAAQAAANSPLPIPEGATAVVFDAVSGELKFDSTQGVPEVAGFYRSNLKKLGWQERPSPIARPEIISLDLTRGGKRLYVSIIQMGRRTHVRAYGPALIAAAAQPAAAPSGKSSAAPAPTATAPAKAEEPLVAEDFDGFPVPESSTSKHRSSSKFRSEVTAKVRGELGTVLAFYRRELVKLNWKEEAGAAVQPDRATIDYSSPDGPASLTLGRDGGMTTISLAWRKPEEAKKAGILPKPGTARVIMGNMIDRQAVVTINNRSITLGAGVGKDAPNGPSLDLPPGKYRYTLKVPGRPASSEDVTVRADQTWALVVGPGGALALNLY
jgi:hypothetical protein